MCYFQIGHNLVLDWYLRTDTITEADFYNWSLFSKERFWLQNLQLKYRGPILRVTSPALGSNDLSLDQSATSIQILQEPNAVMWHIFY